LKFENSNPFCRTKHKESAPRKVKTARNYSKISRESQLQLR